ncbi:carcinoembryonic antigen-related cell adhesion molecule 21-like [Artibeus jamaicensis]|uniref:carcinoembryonic antigen-related cell adhesion molecule 21-like n=1 Tax=Artibeus jamaicensis TaxID=9417 RepID=UPI00235A5954|nr:carcinoembryonic antigen-related cell adhesion molecule 21-like [Artibeus jamaicensis]
MGSSSGSTHRILVHWQELLLVVSLLNFWSQPTTADLMVESTEALEGTDATLRISYKAHNVSVILWFRGKTTDSTYAIAYLSLKQGSHERGPPGAEGIVEDDGSLLLKNVTMKDAGIYTVMLRLEGCDKIISCGQLDVYQHVSAPTLLASNTTVTENRDSVILTCNTGTESETEFIEWLFNGSAMRYTQRMKMSLDRKKLTIAPFIRWDAGVYQCKASNPVSSAESALVKLDVKFE